MIASCTSCAPFLSTDAGGGGSGGWHGVPLSVFGVDRTHSALRVVFYRRQYRGDEFLQYRIPYGSVFDR